MLKKQATDILGPTRFASTLCSTLLNLSFDISWKFKRNEKINQNHFYLQARKTWVFVLFILSRSRISKKWYHYSLIRYQLMDWTNTKFSDPIKWKLSSPWFCKNFLKFEAERDKKFPTSITFILQGGAPKRGLPCWHVANYQYWLLTKWGIYHSFVMDYKKLIILPQVH